MNNRIRYFLFSAFVLLLANCFSQQTNDSNKISPVIFYGSSISGSTISTDSKMLSVKYPRTEGISESFEIIHWSMKIENVEFEGSNYKIHDDASRFVQQLKDQNTAHVTVTVRYQDSLQMEVSGFFIIPGSEKSYDLHYKLLDSNCGIDLIAMTRNTSTDTVTIKKNLACTYFLFKGHASGRSVAIKDISGNLLYEKSIAPIHLVATCDENYFDFNNYSILRLEIFGDYGWEGIVVIR